MAATLQSLLGTAGQTVIKVPTVASTRAAGETAIGQYFNFNLPWFGLFILAGGFPLPPFSYLGFAGLNLYAVGSMAYFSVKAGLQALLTLANTYILAYYPKLWWLGYLLVLNPWYVFDLVQMFSPAFAKDGFKVPLYHTPLGNGGTGKMTPALIALIVGAMSVGSYSLLNMLPPEMQASYKPLLNTFFLTVGTLATLTGGGLTSMLVLPQAYTAIKASLGEARTAFAATPVPVATPIASAPTAVAAPIAPVAPPLTPPPTATPAAASAPEAASAAASAPEAASAAASAPSDPSGAQKGGGHPSLSEVAQKIEAGNINVQAGGGDSSASIFLGTLGVAALGGISLALIRSKAVSSS